MKNLKKGFSLAELLIAIAIISVIAIMGTSIAKNNIERAYNLYVYTGFKGLQDGIADANSQGINMASPSEMAGHLYNLFTNKEASISPTNGYYKVTASNNIQYNIYTDSDTVNDLGTIYYIAMQIPYVKKKDSSTQTVCLQYIDSSKTAFALYPVDEFKSSCSTSASFSAIQDRIDLLPFYIDDGFTGRYAPDINNNNDKKMKYYKKTFYSFREAACKSRGDLDLDNANISCDDYNAVADAVGFLRVENPRKAF